MRQALHTFSLSASGGSAPSVDGLRDAGARAKPPREEGPQLEEATHALPLQACAASLPAHPPAGIAARVADVRSLGATHCSVHRANSATPDSAPLRAPRSP